MADKNTVLVICADKMNSFVIKQSLGNDFDVSVISSFMEASAKINGLISRMCAVICCDKDVTTDFELFIKEFCNRGFISTVPIIGIFPKDVCEDKSRECYMMGTTEVVELPFDPFYLNSKLNSLRKLYSDSLHGCSNDAAIIQRTNVVINILTSVFEFIQFEPAAHITRVKGLANIIAVSFADKYPEYKLDDEDIKYISQAAALHDIGKAAIPTNILFKAGKLTAEEFDLMKTHTDKGVEILQNFGLDHSHKFFDYAFDICKYHHERWDGKGYPDHLEGDQIPIAAQIMSIVDVYDALISERVYKAAIPYDKAITMIREGQCGVFPPKIVVAFNDCEKKFRSYLEDALHVKIVYDDTENSSEA